MDRQLTHLISNSTTSQLNLGCPRLTHLLMNVLREASHHRTCQLNTRSLHTTHLISSNLIRTDEHPTLSSRYRRPMRTQRSRRNPVVTCCHPSKSRLKSLPGHSNKVLHSNRRQGHNKLLHEDQRLTLSRYRHSKRQLLDQGRRVLVVSSLTSSMHLLRRPDQVQRHCGRAPTAQDLRGHQSHQQTL